LLARYASARKVPTRDVLWYVALAGWKIAIIMEGSYKRFLAGITDHPMFSLLDQAVPALARRAQQAARGEFPI
jgi:aminoglycoside phosphotransferase (APT) family kinase protein